MVLGAYERIGIRAPSIRQEHMVTARREMNLMFSEWSNRGVNLWTVPSTPISVPLVNGTAVYSVPLNVVMILDAYITVNNTSPTSASDLYITPVSRTEYASFSNKNTPGRPTCFWFSRTLPQSVAMWPVPDASGPYTLNYYATLQLQDANLPGGETANLPYRWLKAGVTGLAYELAKTYAPQLEAVRGADADKAWTIAAAQDTENVSLSLAPGISSYYRR